MFGFQANTFWLLLLIALCSCGDATLESDDVDEGVRVTWTGETVEFEEGKADRQRTWRVRAPDASMWLNPRLTPTTRDNRTVWVAQGRLSKDLETVVAFSGIGDIVPARLISARKFELALNQEQAIRALAGEPVFFDLYPSQGAHEVYHGSARFKPRLTNFSGTGRLYLLPWLNPFLDAGELVFRARGKTLGGYSVASVYGDDDQSPTLRSEGAANWTFDWSPASLLFAADPVDDLVYFDVTDTAEARLEKRASIRPVLVQLALDLARIDGLRDAECSKETIACLETLDAYHDDTSECGYHAEVVACLGMEIPVATSRARFVEDVRRALIREAAEFETRPLRDAARAAEQVDAGRVVRVLEGDDSAHYDARHFVVFRHPDPVQDAMWYGAYDRRGALLDVYRVWGP